MGKELSEMTLAELWELFPIFLVQHDDKWKNYYKEIEDVMVEISEKADMEELAHVMERNGFIGMSAETNRISLNKGYTKEGFADKVYHIHLRYTGDNDELYFRDYLNEHPQVAKDYESLKLELWKKYEHDRDAYTDAKTEFIRKWTTEARQIYGDRY